MMVENKLPFIQLQKCSEGNRTIYNIFLTQTKGSESQGSEKLGKIKYPRESSAPRILSLWTKKKFAEKLCAEVSKLITKLSPSTKFTLLRKQKLPFSGVLHKKFWKIFQIHKNTHTTGFFFYPLVVSVAGLFKYVWPLSGHQALKD